jgi:predicted TIM-barrel fold metal-dependent hydrolase
VSMVIDAHVHIWRASEVPTYTKTIVNPECDVPIELVDQYLVEHNVNRAVLVQPVFRREDNDYVATCAAAAPDRFAAVCVVDPRLAGAVDRLRYWTEERGCRGLRLRPAIPDEAAVFGDPSTYPLWEYAGDHGLVVSVYAAPEHLPMLASLASRFSEVAIVVDHMAHPVVRLGTTSPQFHELMALSRHPRVFIKVSGYYHYSQQPYPYRDCWDHFRAVYDHFSPSRLIWGSDFPHVLLRSGYCRSLLLQERAYPFLSSDDLNLIMGGTAAALYWGGTR